MFKNLVVASVLLSSITVSAQAAPKTYKYIDGSTFTLHAVDKKEAQKIMNLAKKAAEDSLLDSESARWKVGSPLYRIAKLKKDGSTVTMYCGFMVNAKNRYGAYAGWKELNIIGDKEGLFAEPSGRDSFCDTHMVYGKEIKQEGKE